MLSPSSYASASQLRADILKAKEVIMDSSLGSRAKETTSPVFNNFAAIAAFLMEDPQLVEGAHDDSAVGSSHLRGPRGNRIAPIRTTQPIAYGTFILNWLLVGFVYETLECCCIIF